MDENEMVGAGLFLEEDMKQEPMYHQEVESDIPYFYANNNPLDVKSEDFLLTENVSNDKEKHQDVRFSINMNPLDIKSENVDVVLEVSAMSNTRVSKTISNFTNNGMVGEIVEDIDTIKQENVRALVDFNSLDNIFGGSSRRHECEICGLTLKSRKGLRNHKIRHQSPSEVCMHKCQTCAFKTKYRHSLTNHILNIHGNPLKKFSCENCNYKTNYKSCLKMHSIRNHSSQATNQQSSQATTQQSSQATTQQEEQEKKEYKCESCEYTTKKEKLLKRHSKMHKSPSELTMKKCLLCPYQTKHSGGVVSHMLSHKNSSETTLYKCELCPFETKWRHCHKNHLKRHEQNSEHLTVHKCETCEYTTNNIYSLEIHLKSHAGPPEKPEKIFKCYTCEYQAKRKCHLVNHLMSHKPISQQKLLECAVCNLQMKTRDGFRKHMIFTHGLNIDVRPNL